MNEERELLGTVFSNFDHVFTPDEATVEAKLRQGALGDHAAWHFHGKVWFEDGLFHEKVMQHHQEVIVLSSETLRGVIDEANERFGGE